MNTNDQPGLSGPNRPSCARRWEVEAHRDGRLSGDAMTSHLEHVSRCPVCSRERQAFEQLRGGLVDLAPELDDLSLRRLRRSILEQADAQLTALSPRVPRVPLAVRLVALGALVSLASLASSRFWPRRPPAGSPALPSATAVSSQPASSVTLVAGAAVAPSPSGESPPGTDPSSVPPPPAAPVASTTPAPRNHAAPLRPASPSRPARPDITPPVSDGAAEDAAYLRIVALLREGRDDEARLAARAYLAQFPTGFRRPEVERISR